MIHSDTDSSFMPDVSVIIPTYNSARYLTQAVDSVLAQTFRSIEVVVVDDGSTDDTGLVLQRYGATVKYIRQQNTGVSGARNTGIKNSTGRYVAFLDADDVWHPEKLERQMAALRMAPDCRASYCAFTVTDPSLVPLEITRARRNGPLLHELIMSGNVVGTPSTVVCERSLLEETGAFDSALSQCADWELWVRLSARSNFIYLDEPLVSYRLHGSNMSISAPLLEHDSLLVLNKAFAISNLPASLLARRKAAFARNYMVVAGTYFHARKYLDFARCAARAIVLDFHQLSYLMAYPFRIGARMRKLTEIT